MKKTKKTIFVEIPVETYNALKETGVKYAQIIELGVKAAKGNPQLIERIREIEGRLEKHSKLIGSHAGKIIEIEHRTNNP